MPGALEGHVNLASVHFRAVVDFARICDEDEVELQTLDQVSCLDHIAACFGVLAMMAKPW